MDSSYGLFATATCLDARARLVVAVTAGGPTQANSVIATTVAACALDPHRD